MVRQRLDAALPGEWLDLMPLLANPLPVPVSGQLLGVPDHQQLQVLEHVGRFVRARGLTQCEQTASGGDQAMEVYRRFCLPRLQDRRRQSAADLLSRLIVDPRQGLVLTDDQLLLIVARNFYSASIYTVPLLISNAALLLWRQPQVLDRLRREPGLLASMVEECLRYDPPAQALNASAVREPLELGGCMIPAGASLTALVGAANRDPNPYLSFAPGLHQCLGMHLARLELRAVLQVWLERFSRVEVNEASSSRLLGDRFRGFEHLVVRFS